MSVFGVCWLLSTACVYLFLLTRPGALKFYRDVIAGLVAVWYWLRSALVEALVDLIKHLVSRSAPVAAAPVAPAPSPEPLHHYYRAARIKAAVDDLMLPGSAIIEAVERDLDDEFRVSESYHRDPSLLYEGHPWIDFVRTGHAEYLGWPRDYVPGPSPVQRRRHESRECGWMGCGRTECADRCAPEIESIRDSFGRTLRAIEIHDPETTEYLGSVHLCKCCGEASLTDDHHPWKLRQPL